MHMRSPIAAAALGLAALALLSCQPRPTSVVDHGGAAPPPANLVDHGAPAPPPQGSDPVSQGHRIALSVCTECHVVGPGQREPPRQNPPGPSFQSVADRPGVTAALLNEHLLTTHRTVATPSHMPNPQLMDWEREAVIAYILSLRQPTAAR